MDEPSPSGPPVEGDHALAPGTVLDDKFRIERVLGEGGMGAVYEITHLLTRHRRALKLLHPHVARQTRSVERFFREASAAGHAGNRHIIETFDAGWLRQGAPYLVMELLEGMSLGERLDDVHGVGLPLSETAAIFAPLCEGVQAAHDAGIVHRDLKPDNVFLVSSPGGPRVKVLDFGVSKFDEKLATRLTTGGAFVGTPAYMSPEQFEGGSDVDGRADVYALGVILFEMVTGEHPFPATSMAELARMVLLAEPPTLDVRRSGLPAGLSDVVAAAMERDATIRIPSPQALATQIQAILGTASPPAVAVSILPVGVSPGAPAADSFAPTVDSAWPPAADPTSPHPNPDEAGADPARADGAPPPPDVAAAPAIPMASAPPPSSPSRRRWYAGLALLTTASVDAGFWGWSDRASANGDADAASEPASGASAEGRSSTPTATAPLVAPASLPRSRVPAATAPKPLPTGSIATRPSAVGPRVVPRATPSPKAVPTTVRAGDDDFAP
ncbi:MAG: protein kinase [Myxococcota bacterium]